MIDCDSLCIRTCRHTHKCIVYTVHTLTYIYDFGCNSRDVSWMEQWLIHRYQFICLGGGGIENMAFVIFIIYKIASIQRYLHTYRNIFLWVYTLSSEVMNLFLGKICESSVPCFFTLHTCRSSGFKYWHQTPFRSDGMLWHRARRFTVSPYLFWHIFSTKYMHTVVFSHIHQVIIVFLEAQHPFIG